jgi:hypothetical protein
MRRRLTLDDALRGVQPEPMTAADWDAMHTASAAETLAKHERIALAVFDRLLAAGAHGKVWT